MLRINVLPICVKNIQFINDYVFRIAHLELDKDTVTRKLIKSYYGNQFKFYYGDQLNHMMKTSNVLDRATICKYYK